VSKDKKELRYPPPSRHSRPMKASDFKPQCLEVMDEVSERNIEVVITKRGRPVAKLVPADITEPSPFGFMKGSVLAHGDIVSPDHEAWRDVD
jgi:prevent-host-death family protein